MKKFSEEKHDLLAGIFAVLTFVSIVCEMAFGGFTKEGFVAGVKDISGILIDVLVLLVAASVLIRKPVNFKEKFKESMVAIRNKYEPLLLSDKKEGVIRYNIASNSETNAARRYLNKPEYRFVAYYETGKTITIGDIEITPYLCDHSGFDACMFHGACGGKTLIYSGDFRSNGRKSFSHLLHKLP